MTPSKAVHFRTPREVLEAYKKQQIPAFALFSTKQLITKYQGEPGKNGVYEVDLEEGHQVLKYWVNHFAKIQSAAIHTVTFYEEIPPKGIKDNTPYDCSFNFRFADSPEGYLMPELHAAVGGGQKALLDEITALRMEVDEWRKEKEIGPEKAAEAPQEVVKPSIGEMMFKQVEPFLPLIAERVINGIFGPPAGAVTRISGLTAHPLSPQEQLRMNDALDTLKESIPDLVPVLEKLALISTRNPVMFTTFMNYLKGLQV